MRRGLRKSERIWLLLSIALVGLVAFSTIHVKLSKALYETSQPAAPGPQGSHPFTHHIADSLMESACPQTWVTGSWTSLRSMGKAALPLTAEAQREIYDAMHPRGGCVNARYLVHTVSHENGLGAAIHVAGVALRLALDTGRILVEAPGTFFADGVDECGLHRHTLDSCYLLPWGGCRPTARQIMVASERLLPGEIYGEAPIVFTSDDDLERMKYQVPERFLERLKATPIDPAKYHYWWRAQASSYLVRPEPGLLVQLEQLREDMLRGPPPIPGCIALTVRRGDNGKALKIQTDTAYDAAAAKLHATDPAHLTNNLFLSSEDPSTLAFFVNGTGAAEGAGGHRWRTGYTIRQALLPSRDEANNNATQEVRLYGQMLSALLNLDLALECSAFVGSIDSHWVRLVDELRSTLRCKADAPYMDVRYSDPRTMDLKW